MPIGLTRAQPNFTISQDFGQLTFRANPILFSAVSPAEKGQLAE
jgi:hypothetical protein